LKQNKINKRFVYLISPSKIKSNEFYIDLEQVLNSKKVSFFQLRLKNETSRNKIFIGKKIKKICKKHRVKFLVNDEPYLAKKLKADGCHIGQKDMSILKVKKILKKKIIGITCHNSINLVKQAIKRQPNYIALGAFYSSKTKKVKFKANMQILKYAKNITKIPNFLAISGYVWNNKKLKPIEAINKLK
jgi:thiamine-phosphate pyrophosphorylase